MEQHPKTRDRAVLLALQADCRGFAGFGEEAKGLAAVADVLGCDKHTLHGQISPENHEKAMPSMAKLLTAIQVTGGEYTLRAMAALGGKRVVDFDLPGPAGSSADCVQEFHRLLAAVGPLLTEGCARAQDGVFCSEDRRRLMPLLVPLIQQIHALRDAFAQDDEEGRQ